MKFKFLKDMVLNPDGLTYSSKRVAGFIALFTFIGFGVFNKEEHIMYSTLALVASFWGLTSFDYTQFIKSKPSPTDPSTGDTPVNP